MNTLTFFIIAIFQIIGCRCSQPEISVNSNNLSNKVLDSLTRALKFYEAHLNQLSKRNTALALIVLKAIDNKHGQILQENFPLEKWVQGLCDSSNKVNRASGHFCWTLNRYWKNRSGSGNSTNSVYWKTLNETFKDNLQQEEHLIGNENWEARIIHQCEMSLVNRCKVPYVCRTILLDRKPKSQYLLTHQLLYRVFIEMMDCPATKSLETTKDNEIYENLCAKMWMEAEYLEGLNVPVAQRDLFAELVGFCGHMGYTTFLREAWLERMLSWQSTSDYGCFVKDRLSTDVGLKRQATQKEMEAFGVGYRPSEKCSPHLTAVGLVALSAYWDFLLDTQS